MTEDSPRVKDAYSQMKLFLEQAKEESDLNHKIELLKKDLENFVKETKINDMIKSAIEEHDKNIEKANQNRIKWGPIIQSVVTAVLIALITALVIKGWNS